MLIFLFVIVKRYHGSVLQCAVDEFLAVEHILFDIFGLSTSLDIIPIIMSCYQEIVLVPQPEERIAGWTYYMTLMRGELQVRHGDCIYIHRDSLPMKTPHTELSHLPTQKFDIFRIERLWKDEK